MMVQRRSALMRALLVTFVASAGMATAAAAQVPVIGSVKAENPRLTGDRLTVDLVITLQTPTALNNMILVQQQGAGQKYWASTHDFAAAAAEGTVRCTVTIPKFKRPKQGNALIGVIVVGGGGITFDPGQPDRELDLKKAPPWPFSKRTDASFEVR